MKPKLFIFLFTLSVLSFAACSPKKPVKELKIMTWNIWHGGLHGSKADNFEKDTTNTLNVFKVIKQNDPDIIFMQETYCCGMEIAKEAGYPYSWRSSSNLSIHSKFPITDTLNIYKPFNSQGVIIDVEGEKIICVNLWLHYLPDFFNDIKTMPPDSLILGEGETRLKEITEILKEVDQIQEEYSLPVIMGGDFNSGSHLDWGENTKKWHYNKVVEWPVSKLVVEHGFTDSFREANPDPLKTMEGTWGFLGDDIISDRIDYIYYRGEKVKIKSSEIVMDDPKEGFFNSDHRAILTVFYLK
jgi:exonuclease III